MHRWLLVVAVALPGLVLAVAGYHHPGGLDVSTATMWWTAHVPLIPVFPLLGVVLWALVRDERGPLKVVAVVGAYVYGCFYTALDCLAGIAAGLVLATEGRGQQSILELIRLGDRLSYVGTAAYLVATVAVAASVLRRAGLAALPGAVLLVGAAVPFQTSHIFWPTGVAAMVASAAGAALLEWARTRSGSAASPSPHAAPAR